MNAKLYQSFKTITFHYQIDALGSISELKTPNAPEALFFIIKSMLLLTVAFHYENYLFVAKTIPEGAPCSSTQIVSRHGGKSMPLQENHKVFVYIKLAKHRYLFITASHFWVRKNLRRVCSPVAPSLYPTERGEIHDVKK